MNIRHGGHTTKQVPIASVGLTVSPPIRYPCSSSEPGKASLLAKFLGSPDLEFSGFVTTAGRLRRPGS